MSFWWAAALLVAALGAIVLSALARRCRREARQARHAAEGLRSALVDLGEARRDLVLDMTRYATQEPELVAEPAEKGPAPK